MNFVKRERKVSKEKSHTLALSGRKFISKKRIKNLSPTKCMIITKPKPLPPLINSNSNKSNFSYHSDDYYESEEDGETVIVDEEGNEKIVPSPRRSKRRKLRAYNKKLHEDFLSVVSKSQEKK